MIPLDRISSYWHIDIENTGLASWDECNNTPDEFCIYLVSERYQDYCISIEVSLHSWTVGMITLWHDENGHLRPVAHTRSDRPDLADLLLDWAHHPQKYEKEND